MVQRAKDQIESDCAFFKVDKRTFSNQEPEIGAIRNINRKELVIGHTFSITGRIHEPWIFLFPQNAFKYLEFDGVLQRNVIRVSATNPQITTKWNWTLRI
jgi:hypothetical protein